MSDLTALPAWNDITSLRDQLVEWATQSAFDIWHLRGVDAVGGGFIEKIDLDGKPLAVPRRARVTPRQIYSFAVSAELGWKGPWQSIVEAGLEGYFERFFRPDGLIRTLVAQDGTVLDDSVSLYDQAFGLFALAHAQRVLPNRTDIEPRASALLALLQSRLGHPLGGFDETSPRTLPLQSNPHMHLFEASLAWAEISSDPTWQAQADQIGELCLAKFIEPDSGGVREYFDADWNPAEGTAGRKLEPGHQFEWGWLLLRWGQAKNRMDALAAAKRMIALAEDHGVDPQRGVAMNVLLSDLSVHDAQARLWPQTERIKANILLAQITGDAQALEGVVAGVHGLMTYFDVPVPGLWRDRMEPDGSFVQEAAPASSFYHILCAILELHRAVEGARGA